MKTQSLSTLTKTQMTNNNEKLSVCCGAEKRFRAVTKKQYGNPNTPYCGKCGNPFIAQEEKKCCGKCFSHGMNGESLCERWLICDNECSCHSSPTQSVEEKRDCSKCGTKYGESTKWGTCECPVSPTQDWAVEEFDKRYESVFTAYPDNQESHKILLNDIKSFISQTITKGKEEERERYETIILGLQTALEGQQIMINSFKANKQ